MNDIVVGALLVVYLVTVPIVAGFFSGKADDCDEEDCSVLIGIAWPAVIIIGLLLLVAYPLHRFGQWASLKVWK